MKTSPAILILLLLMVGVFSLATALEPRALKWEGRSGADSVLKTLLGDSRQMFANHFFVKADVSFHSGYYPSIFDQAREAEEKEDAVAHGGEHSQEHEEEGGFLGKPTDWIDRFGRHFRITEHTHLQGGNMREILPWLQISAELDPHRIETYIVASYWLRSRLGKVDEAEQFLREGMRANPDSYEIPFDLGRLYYENRHDAAHARNLWLLALRRWNEHQLNKKDPDFGSLHDIELQLAHLEENEGNYAKAIEWMEKAEPYSPNPEALQSQMDALRAKLAAKPKQ